MDSVFIVGTILAVGYTFGEFAEWVRLPRITGYILAGVVLNPGLFRLIPPEFPQHTQLVTDIALSFITFSVGGELLWQRVKKLGKPIIWITLLEAEFAMLAVIGGFTLAALLFGLRIEGGWVAGVLPLSILLGSFASPTDPSATLAVVHEYKAHGPVTSTIMGVAAFDDVCGIMNFSLAVAIAGQLIGHRSFSVFETLGGPALSIAGAVGVGVVFGLALDYLSAWLKKETEGELIVLVFAALTTCYGAARMLHLDALLATMSMGVAVVNRNKQHEKIFRLLERYEEELIFVFFFALGGMHLKFPALLHSFLLVGLFVVLRAAGKFLGTLTGAAISKAPKKVRHFTALGLVPQGGIVIGLALTATANPDFASIADVLVGVVIGATVIHELIGPFLSEMALTKAGEIRPAAQNHHSGDAQ